MASQSAHNPVRPSNRSGVRAFARSPVLERCARAAAKASGYIYTGTSITAAAKNNPRAAQFVAVAKAVLAEAEASKE
jgi:hypothetical protein